MLKNSRSKTSSISPFFLSSHYKPRFFECLDSEKCLNMSHLYRSRRMSSTLSVATISGQKRWVADTSYSSFKRKSRLNMTVWIVDIVLPHGFWIAWGHQVLHPGHSIPLSVCFTAPRSSKYSSCFPISTLDHVVLLTPQQCTGKWNPSPLIGLIS